MSTSRLERATPSARHCLVGATLWRAGRRIIGPGGMGFIPADSPSPRPCRTSPISPIFVKVVELSSFTAAADALEMSQPVVSKAVTRLEEKLGARLLNRTTRRLSLTEAGSELYRRSVRALEEIENAELEVARFQTEPRGTLRVSAPMSFSILHLGPVLQAFLERYPGVTVELNLDDRQVDLVEEGFDVAIRIGRLQDSNLDRAQDHAVSPGDVRIARLSREARHAGAARTICSSTTASCTRSSARRASGASRVRGREARRAGQRHAAFQQRPGESQLRRWLAPASCCCRRSIIGDQLRCGELKPMLCKFSRRRSRCYAVYPERRNLTPKVRAFVDFLARDVRRPRAAVGAGLDPRGLSAQKKRGGLLPPLPSMLRVSSVGAETLSQSDLVGAPEGARRERIVGQIQARQRRILVREVLDR